MNWLEVVSLLLALLAVPVCIWPGASRMRDMPTKQSSEMRPWVIGECVFFYIAWCGLIIHAIDAVNTLPSQHPDVIGLGVAWVALICSEFPVRRVQAIRHAYLDTQHSPVPDDLAMRRAIVHRLYRRGLRHSRWR